MGSDFGNESNFIKVLVSIHAPTWGATECGVTINVNQLVSIHAPTWGATAIRQAFRFIVMFQSTLPHGERQKYAVTINNSTVSIHAPTWGATLKTTALGYATLFQSTLPHGERLTHR